MTAQTRPLRSGWLNAQAQREETAASGAFTFTQLYDAYFGRVFTYARYRCGDDVLADDLTALVFERVFSHLADYDPKRGPVEAWLFTIARNVINNHLRAETRRNHLPLEHCEWQPDQAALPEESLIQGETQAEILEALADLGERERDILGLKFTAGLTNRRIAEMTGLSENNIGVILYRAIHRLRLILVERQKRHE